MGKSKELKVMARCWNQLVPVIRNNLEEVSLFLYNKDIIRKQTRDEAIDSSIFGPEERAKKVLRALEDKIEEDDDNYYVFVCFLSSKSKLSKLVKSLSTAFCKLGGKVEDYDRRVSDIKERKSLTQESTSGTTGSHQSRDLQESWQPSMKPQVQMTEELNLKNIKNRLKRHVFSSSCAEKLGSGASTSKAEEKKEVHLRQRKLPLLPDPKKPSSGPQRHLSSSQTFCCQCRRVIIGVGVAAGLILLVIVFLFVSKGFNSNSSASTGMHQKHTSTLPDKDTSHIKSDSTDCTRIESAKKLENVLKEVRISGDKMCRDLGITSCNSMDRKDAATLSQNYMEQHPEPCLEDITEMLLYNTS